MFAKLPLCRRFSSSRWLEKAFVISGDAMQEILAHTEPIVNTATTPAKRRMSLNFPHLYKGPITKDREFSWNGGKNLDSSELEKAAAAAKFCEAFRLVNFTNVDTFGMNTLFVSH